MYINVIDWINRYSDTDESDSQNRWARIAYYKHSKGVLGQYKYRLGWVNRVYDVNRNSMYSLSLYFPVNNYPEGYHKIFNTYEECQIELEKLFKEFIDEITI